MKKLDAKICLILLRPLLVRPSYIFLIIHIKVIQIRDKWVSVTTAWRVLRLWMEERPPMWRIAANILNKQSRTSDKWRSSILRVGRDANNPTTYKLTQLRNINGCLESGQILRWDVSNGKGTFDSVHGMLGACMVRVTYSISQGISKI
jgi:hypothetical protein